MSYMLIILLVFLFLRGNGGNLTQILSSLNLDDVAPILQTFGVDTSILETLKSQDFSSLLSGNFDLKTLLPLITPLLKNFMQKGFSTTSTANFESQSFSDNISPIKDIANEDISAVFIDYLTN